MIKKGDNIIVIAGSDKGKKGKVAKVFPKKQKAIVEGVNIKKRKQKPKQKGQKGQIIDVTMPIHISNIMRSDSKTGKGVRKKKES